MAKVMISLPDELLGRLDRRATSAGLSRSAFIRDAVESRLETAGPGELDRAIERARGAMVGAGSFESVDLIREQREARDGRDRSSG